jgi:O-methyltransferase
MKNFNWENYIANYPDLRNAGISTKHQALKHYLIFGKKENRTDKNVEYDNIIKICNQYSMISYERFVNNINSVKNVERNKIEGDIIEIGVWKGGSILSMILACTENIRNFYLYDTFEGFTDVQDIDKDHNNILASKILSTNEFMKCICYLDDVKKNIYNFTKNECINFIKGDIVKNNIFPSKIAILRLDTDYYESTKYELENFYPLVSDGGIIIIDDYNAWSGCKKAVDDFIKNKPIKLIIIDSVGVYFIKNTTELCLLAHKYYVDKCPFYNHTYTPKYHNLLNSLRESTKTVLEIGIGNIPLMQIYTGEKYKPGGSLRMWRDYFINAHIYGCDILENVLFNEERITTILLDQSNEASLNNLKNKLGNMDIIIDDGSHIESHMFLTFKILWDIVNPGGVYIIEDINKNSLKLFAKLSENNIIYEGIDICDNFIAFYK